MLQVFFDRHGRKYKLLMLVVGGVTTTYQRFVWSQNRKMYRIGTKEPNVEILRYDGRANIYLGFPIVQQLAISTILLYNLFENT